MPPKTKRTVKERENGTALDDSSPSKRLRTEDTHTGTLESQNGVASPAQIEEPVELDEDEEDEVTEVAPTPILGDLYLETVCYASGGWADDRSIDRCWNLISKKFVRSL